MANFIISLLKQNRNKIEEIKSVVFEQDNMFTNKWAYRNLPVLVVFLSFLVVFLFSVVLLLLVPIVAIMCTINVVYSICELVMNLEYFNRKFIKESLANYEASLNKEETYFLAITNQEKDWNCVVLDVNVNEFIKTFLKSHNSTYYTYGFKTKNLICRKGRRRSIGDIYLVCKNYYPDTRLDDVIVCLIKLIDEKVIAVSKCSEINKYVFTKKNSYTDNYTGKDVEFIRGISFEQLIEYYGRNRRLS